jgi:hypothetical protein
MKKLLPLMLVLLPGLAGAQSFDLAHLDKLFGKGNPVKVNGGVSASGIYYTGNDGSGREPFTWFLQGNLNINILGQVSAPFSFNLTNVGSKYTYPSLPNRLSLTPTYKWVTLHIGDVSMNFSPYTLSGHLFTGVGVDLAPEGHWKASAMYGRLQRAVRFDSLTQPNPPAYERWGYGSSLMWKDKGLKLGLIVFGAKDRLGSLALKPDSLGILPQQNMVISWTASVKPARNMELSGEYATSAFTRDVRDTVLHKDASSNLLFLHGNSTTAYYHAEKIQLNYTFMKSVIGVGYERVDPGYQTMGAYYFTNDLENITVNLARPFFGGKVTLAGNVGIQRDNLGNTEDATNHRLVSSVNLAVNPNHRLSTSFSYSNFQTYMYIRPQFAYINQLTPYQNLDTLNYSQVSQNANLNVNYVLGTGKTISQNVNLNLSFQDAYNEQGGTVAEGNSSLFYNAALAYSFIFVPQGVSFTTAFNGTYNAIDTNGYTTLGPTLAVNSRLLHKKLVAGFSSSYNVSNGKGSPVSSVLNFRWNFALAVKKKQSLGLNVVQQYTFISVAGQRGTNSLVATMAYNYRF